MSPIANFEVYLQALGGKFIGQNAFLPHQIKVSIFINGIAHPLAYYAGKTNPPDDGEVGPAYFDGSSSVVPILTNTTDIESITVIANQQSTGNFGTNRLNF